jgi:hypothetical protein
MLSGNARLLDRIQYRPRHDAARPRGSQLPQIDRRLFRARAVAGHRRRESRSGQRCQLPLGWARTIAITNYERVGTSKALTPRKPRVAAEAGERRFPDKPTRACWQMLNLLNRLKFPPH